MNLVFRRAVSADAQIVADTMTEAMRYKLSKGDDAWDDQPYTVEEVRPLIKSTYLIFNDDALVGSVGLQSTDKLWDGIDGSAYYIHRLAVRDAFHGRGIGEQIISWALRKAESRGCEYLRGDCPTHNRQLCEYYEGQGFRSVAIREVGRHQVNLYQREVGS